MDEIKGNIDSSYVNGFIHIKNMTQPLVRYDFNVDKLDLHDYRLVTGKSGQDTVPLPLDFLRSADMSGVLNIESLALDDLQLMGFNATTNIKDGVVKINPVSMKVKESTVSAAMRLSVHSQPYGAMRIKASNVDSRLTINPWLKTLLGDNALQLDGAISLDASLKLKGDNLTMLRESAEGKIKLNMGKTTVYGIDLDHASRTVVADYANKNNFRTRSSYVPEYNPQEPVVFNSLSANYTLSYGKLMTKDLILKSDLADVKLTGNIDLIKEVIGYRLVLDMHVKNPVDIRDKLRNHPMEYSSRGTFGRVVTDFDYNHYDHLVSRMLMIEAKSRKIRQIKQSQQKSGRLY